jgi:hypothetical protein
LDSNPRYTLIFSDGSDVQRTCVSTLPNIPFTAAYSFAYITTLVTRCLVLSRQCNHSVLQVALHISHYPFSLFLWAHQALSIVTTPNFSGRTFYCPYIPVWPGVRSRTLSPSQSTKRSPLCHVPLAAVVQKTQHRLYMSCPCRPLWPLSLYKFHEPSIQTATKQTPFRIHSTTSHSISSIMFRG